MREIRIQRSRAVSLRIAVCGLALVLIGVFTGYTFYAVLGAPLFAFGGVFYFDRTPKVTVSPAGIQFASWGPKPIPWAELTSFRFTNWGSQRFLEFQPADDSRFRQHLSAYGRLNHAGQRLFKQPCPSIPIGTLEHADEVVALLSASLPRQVSREELQDGLRAVQRGELEFQALRSWAAAVKLSSQDPVVVAAVRIIADPQRELTVGDDIPRLLRALELASTDQNESLALLAGR